MKITEEHIGKKIQWIGSTSTYVIPYRINQDTSFAGTFYSLDGEPLGDHSHYIQDERYGEWKYYTKGAK